MRLDSEAVVPAGYLEQFRPLRLGRLRGQQTRRTDGYESRPNYHIILPYLHNFKFPLYFVVVSITLERQSQLFYLSCLVDMTSAPGSRKF